MLGSLVVTLVGVGMLLGSFLLSQLDVSGVRPSPTKAVPAHNRSSIFPHGCCCASPVTHTVPAHNRSSIFPHGLSLSPPIYDRSGCSTNTYPFRISHSAITSNAQLSATSRLDCLHCAAG